LPVWYLYLIRCGDGSIYTGVSTDVPRRLAEHRSGKGARYLRGRGPLALARKIRVGDKSAACRIEALVKKFPRSKKEDLVSGKIGKKDLSKRNKKEGKQ
jgi:predicted GIY-YIG superfamily endonuclease